MPDVILDTNILADLLSQFFGAAQRGRARFVEQDTITRELARKTNQIVRWHDWHLRALDDEDRYPGRVVASTFAFVEIARKWTDIVKGRFEIEQMASFIEQPPEWFVIEPVDENLVLAFCDVPTDVLMANGELRSVEWADAVHIATAFGRGYDSLLAVTDREMRQVNMLQDRLI
jgi:predicted nucleic acid-binding protein